MRRLVALLASACVLASSCGPLLPAASNSPVTLTVPGGQVMKVRLDDRTGLVQAFFFVVPDAEYDSDESGGIAVKNVAGDTSRVRISWIGGACSPNTADVTLERSNANLSITVKEPVACTDAKGRVKTLELDLSSAVPAESIKARWLPR